MNKHKLDDVNSGINYQTQLVGSSKCNPGKAIVELAYAIIGRCLVHLFNMYKMHCQWKEATSSNQLKQIQFYKDTLFFFIWAPIS